MCSCWEEDPELRPTFDQISTFISTLLANSERDFEYSYVRAVTQHIPDDYILDSHQNEYEENDGYIQSDKLYVDYTFVNRCLISDEKAEDNDQTEYVSITEC